MKKYEVIFQVTVEVEAEDERQAQYLAECEMGPSDCYINRCMAVFELDDEYEN